MQNGSSRSESRTKDLRGGGSCYLGEFGSKDSVIVLLVTSRADVNVVTFVPMGSANGHDFVLLWFPAGLLVTDSSTGHDIRVSVVIRTDLRGWVALFFIASSWGTCGHCAHLQVTFLSLCCS